ncbi:unnamed protein product [Peronospora farinosa]|uniref:J domain-containing protein n=1 Tax=Peronospora farinosa TaxID=134698 RepID=A0AAV0SWS8_9STRA|nr:unnamed protein product [Peronospora farinosa]
MLQIHLGRIEARFSVHIAHFVNLVCQPYAHATNASTLDASSWRQFERDYYALLGVSRDASSEEIRSCFLYLSREFHPDRHPQRHGNTSLVAAANAQYAVLDRAYRVLFDPIKRGVYDSYGEKGVIALEKEGGTQQQVIGAHFKSLHEVQHYVEKGMQRMNQQALEAQFSSFSEMSMAVDASNLVQAPMQGMRSLCDSGARFVDRTEMTIHQRTVFPLSRSTTLTLGGYMYDKKGLGMGSFTAQLAHTSFDPSIPSFTLSSELGWAPKLNCQISQPVSPYTVFMLIPELDDNGLDISMGANQLLTPQLHGAMMWSTRDGLSGSLSQDTGAYNATAAVAINGGGPNLTFQFHRALVAATTGKLSLRANLATDLSFVAGASVTLRLGFTRGSVRFVMPIFLSSFSRQSAFSTLCAATLPFVVAALVTQLVGLVQERKRRLKLERRHDMFVQYLAAARHNAMEQQKLMLRCAKEKMEQDQQQEDGKGLVVLLGRYGKNPTSSDQHEGRGNAFDVALRTMPERELNYELGDEDDPGSGDSIAQQEADAEVLEQKWVDVSIPLQFFVKLGDFALSSASKAGLLEFYNPCIGEDQTISDARSPSSFIAKPLLYVHYAYDGQVFEATYDDDQAISLPSRYAQVMDPVGRVY